MMMKYNSRLKYIKQLKQSEDMIHIYQYNKLDEY